MILIGVVRNHHQFFNVICHMILIGLRIAEAARTGERKFRLTESPYLKQIEIEYVGCIISLTVLPVL